MKDKNKEMTIAIISGAAHALKYKEKNPRATDAEILKYISLEASNISSKIDRQ